MTKYLKISPEQIWNQRNPSPTPAHLSVFVSPVKSRSVRLCGLCTARGHPAGGRVGMETHSKFWTYWASGAGESSPASTFHP